MDEFGATAESVHLSKDLVVDLLESSLRTQEVAETLEVQLDKKTMKRLKLGESQLKRGPVQESLQPSGDP